MTAYTLRFSNEPVVTLPMDLARLAGLREGDVQIVPGNHSVTVTPVVSETDYALRWQVMETSLREQAAHYGLEIEDHRDEEYWAIVGPLLQEAEHWISSV